LFVPGGLNLSNRPSDEFILHILGDVWIFEHLAFDHLMRCEDVSTALEFFSGNVHEMFSLGAKENPAGIISSGEFSTQDAATLSRA